MQEAALKKLFAISVKARALRAWQERSEGGPKGLSEREVLVLELVEEFTQYFPVTESDVGKVFGLSPSSVSDLVGRLSKHALLRKEVDEKGHTRSKPLQVTQKGRRELERGRRGGAARFAYLFADISTGSDWRAAMRLLDMVDSAATRAVRKHIFGQYELDFEDLKEGSAQ